MKSLFRVSIIGLLMFAVVAISTQSISAQVDKTELYTKFTCCWEREKPADIAKMSPDELQESVDTRKEALAAGKEFVANYGTSVDDKQIVDWLNANLPGIETTIKSDEQLIIDKRKQIESAARFDTFNNAYKAKNWSAMFAAGDVILKAEPEFYDVAIVLASIGFDEAEDKKDALNEQTIKYAMIAIDRLESGAKPKSDTCAGSYFNYKTKEFPNCVPNALGWMNYTIGYIKHFRQQKTDEAIPYLFKATQADSATKDIPAAYRPIGAWYISKSQAITKKRNEVVAERNAASELPAPDVENIKMLDIKIDNMIGVERGYAERAIDAYSRAYSLIPAADRTKEYGAGIFNTLKQLYQFRYTEKPEMQTDAQINMNVSMVKTKSMPNPDSEVQPVNEIKPVAPEATTPTTVKTGTSRSRTVTEKATSSTVDN